MGQSRYERLPKTQNWQSVVALLASPDASAPLLASATVKSCRAALKQHCDDPVLVSAVYLLAHLPVAARQGKAADFLEEAGLHARALSSPMALIEETSSFLNQQSFQNARPSFVTEIALRAFQ
jgi:Cys-tRNA synthase (O-phospho-L-seryl-tRNA:Cys-tRNA synthase)